LGLLHSLGKTRNINKEKNRDKAPVTRAMVKSMIAKPVETKYFDQSQAQGAVNAGTITCVTDITRGTDVTQRIGNEVMLKEMQVRMSFTINANVNTSVIRYVFAVDTMGVNAPSVGDVLESGLLSTGYTDIAPYYWDYRRRFKILHDDSVGLCKYANNAYLFKHFTLPLGFRSSNIGASTTFKNHVYLIIVGAEANVLNISNVQYHLRTLFTDE